MLFLARDLYGSSISGELKCFHSSPYPSHLVQYIHTINIFLNEFIERTPAKRNSKLLRRRTAIFSSAHNGWGWQG